MHPPTSCMGSGLVCPRWDEVMPLSSVCPSVCLSAWDASVLWPNGLDDQATFLAHTLCTATVTVLGGCPNPFRGRASSCQNVGRGPPKLAKNMFEDWRAISRKRCMIRRTYMKLPKLYRLTRSPVIQHDLKRSKIAQFLFLCPALFHSALGTTKKWRGTVKKIS